MRKRVLSIFTLLSTGLLALTLGLGVASFWVNPSDHYVSLSRDLHVSVWERGWDIRLVFFDNAQYGPYRGSITGFVGDPTLKEEVGFGDVVGIYYRSFRWNSFTVWTLLFSIWYPVVLFAALPVYRLLRPHRHRGRMVPESSQSVSVDG